MTPETPATAPLLPSLPANRALDEHLRRSLAVLRDQSSDPALQARIDDVIAGRSSLRALARDGAFGAMIEPLVRRGMQQLDALSDDERRAAAEGATAFERGEVPGAGPAPGEPGSSHGTW
jgi:hypothetical protein